MGKNQEAAEEYAKNINVRKTKAAAEFTPLFLEGRKLIKKSN